MSNLSARYERNFKSLSAEQQASLHEKKVCVVGCGGLGGLIIETLARIGVLHLTVVDGDVFEASNLNRQILSDESVIGEAKALVAKKRIQEINSAVSVTPHVCLMNKENVFELIKGHDVIVDALDNVKGRVILANACKKSKLPMVHGAISGWDGQVATILPNSNTFETLYNNVTDETVNKSFGNLPFTASLVASLQTAEVVKVLLQLEPIYANGFLRIELLHNEFTWVEL